MRIIRFLTAIIILLIMAACGARMQTPEAPVEDVAPIEVNEAWLRPALAGGNSAAYMDITNNTDSPITLTGVTVDFAGLAQIHQTTVENEMARMEHMENGLRIAADNILSLQAGGYHIMLMDVYVVLNEGDILILNLEFDNGETIAVDAIVSITGSQQD